MVKDMGMTTDRQADIVFENQRMEDVNITGGTANLNVLSNIQTETGRYFTEGENQNRRQVAFIGADLKEKFFPNVDPVGKEVQLNGRPYI